MRRAWTLLPCLAACHADPVVVDASASDVVSADVVRDDVRDAASDAASDAVSDPCGNAGAVPGWATIADHAVVLRCDAVSLRVASWAPGVLRLRYEPTGAEAARGIAVVGTASPEAVRAVATSGGARVCTASHTVDIAAGSCRITVRDRGGPVLVDDGDDGGWSAQRETLDGLARTVARLRRRSDPAEQYYGVGERTGPLARRGTRNVFWNTDAYESRYGGVAPTADPLYASVPWVVTQREGYAFGLLTDTTFRAEVDLAATDPAAVQWRTWDGVLDQYVVDGPTMPEVMARYRAMTGSMPTPPRWSLGYHQSRWGYQDTARVEAVAQGFRDRRIPMDTVWLDIQHMDGFRTFTWDPTRFADARGMLSRLRAMGVHAVAICDPGLKVDPMWSVSRDGVSGGHFLHRADGTLIVGTVWPGPSNFPDMTRAATRRWWGDLAGAFAGDGLSGVWLDVNEPTLFPESGGGSLADDTPVDGDGVAGTMGEFHNAYGMLEARATREGLARRFPDRRPFVLTRAGYAGIQRYAAMWTGDMPSTWTALRQQLPTMMNLGLSGVAFVGSDVGGYSGSPSPELYARWMALGSISPFFRGHVTNGAPDQEPWAFGPEVEAIARARIQVRYQWLPYLAALFDEATRTGAPVLRPMVYEFSDEPSLRTVDDQAMLGPWVMVAPVLTEGATRRRVVFPRGRWVELDSGATVDGPTAVDLDVTLASLPLFLREGAVVPRGPVMQYTDERPLDAITLDVVPSRRETATTLYDDAGDGPPDAPSSRVTVRVVADDAGATIRWGAREGAYRPPSRTVTLRVRPVDAMPTSVRVDDVALAMSTDGRGWRWDANDRALWITVPDPDGRAMTVDARYDVAVQPRPTVRVPVVVTVPAGTPRDPPVTIATSANGWTHQPLAWSADGRTARGDVEVPRGGWFDYKYARGDWTRVEVDGACAELRNRYGFGAATPAREDTVARWRDGCP